MLDFARFFDALHADGGLERHGVHLSAEKVAQLRGHDAYALAWFDNWSRDGQPADGRVHAGAPYPPSPDIDVSTFTITGYAITGEDPTVERAAEREQSALRGAAGGETVRTSGRVAVAAPPEAPGSGSPRTPEPGWYPSPSSSAHEQWWDGDAWTPERRLATRRRRGLGRFAR